jgi:hypothetical protein
MLPIIPKAERVAGYRKTLMGNYLVSKTIDPLRGYMHLPDRVSEAKVILMMHIESNPHLKNGNPSKVIDNLISEAIVYHQTTGKPLDFRFEVPPPMMLLSSEDSRSVSSRGTRFGDEDELEVARCITHGSLAPKPQENQSKAQKKELTEEEIKKEEQELELYQRELEEQFNLKRRKAEVAKKKKEMKEQFKLKMKEMEKEEKHSEPQSDESNEGEAS